MYSFSNFPIVAVIFWSSFHVFLFVWGYMDSSSRSDCSKLQGLLGVSFYAARAAAFVINFDCALILLPISVRSLTLLRKVLPFSLQRRGPFNFDEHVAFHKRLGYSIVLASLVHSWAHYFNYLRLEQADRESALKQAIWNNLATGEKIALVEQDDFVFRFGGLSWKLCFTSIAGATGHLLWLALLWIATGPRIRRVNYEAFSNSHYILFLVFFILLLLHGMGCFLTTDSGKCLNPTSYKWVIPGLAIYLIYEVLYRMLVSGKRPVQLVKLVEHPNKVLEIQFRSHSDYSCSPGQYVLLRCPALEGSSKILGQWHPFTLTRTIVNENDERELISSSCLSVHIRIEGDWTRALFEHCLQSPTSLVLFSDGGFGTCSDKILNYESFCLFGAGIGVTPFAAILRYLVQRRRQSREIVGRQVYFYWICRDFTAFEWFLTLLQEIEQEDLEGFIQLQVFVTNPFLNERIIKNIAAAQKNNPTFPNCDPITGLFRCKTLYGRPNFDLLLASVLRDQIVQSASSSSSSSMATTVGVFTCGPKGMTRSLEQACQRMNSTLEPKGYLKYYYCKGAKGKLVDKGGEKKAKSSPVLGVDEELARVVDNRAKVKFDFFKENF